jgi:carbonic anhydrase/acetyltransferase-like protein (isoleucine patch superfamily)
VIAAGAVVPEGMVVEPGSLMAGVPAVAKRTLNPDRLAQLAEIGGLYVQNAARFRASLRNVKGES